MAVNIISSNTTLERDGLPPVPSGTLIYNSDTQQLEFTNDAGISWSGVGLTTLQEAYDAGPNINMDSNVDFEVYSSTGRLAFSVIEGGNTSGVQVNRALQIDYPDFGGPALFFQHLTPTAPGTPIASIGGQTQASNGFSKSFESMIVQVVNDTDAAFEAETVFKNIVNNAQIDCFKTGVQNVSFRDLNMQNNPITNVGVLQANVRIETPAIDMLLGSIFNCASVESQALVSSGFLIGNYIEQTNQVAPGGFLQYVINNQSPASNGAVSWEMTHSALNSNSNPFLYLKEEHVTQDTTAGNETAQRKFYCANFGTTDEYMRFTGNANQINLYKTLDMSGNSIVACDSVTNNNGSINFSNFPELKLYTFGSNEMLLESTVGNIKINNKIIYVPDGQAITSVTANTTYVFLGDHEFTSTLTINQPGVVISGTGRENSKIFGSFAGPLINIVDQDFELNDITLTASGDDTFAITGSNIAAGQPNLGRLKTINITNAQLRNCVNGIDFVGFDLIDISQTLFYYFQARSDSGSQTGVIFKGTSKVELTSCEFLRWFEEATIASPINYFVGNMIEFVNNTTPASGFGAVNVSSLIVHPQQNQNGIVVDNAATFGFANCTGSTFVDGNLNTPTYQPLVIDIDLQPSWIVEANQNVPNLVAYINAEVDNNALVTTISAVSTPTPFAATTFIDNGLARVTLNSSTGVITKDSKRPNFFTINLTGQLTVQAGGNNQNLQIGLLANGVPTGPTAKLQADSGVPIAFSYNVIGFANQLDTFQLYVQNDTGANDILLNNLQLAGVEV